MTLPTPFIDGFRLTDGSQLNNVTGNPQWSTSEAMTATLGGTVITSAKIVNAVTNVSSAAGNGAGVTLPQAVQGLIKIVVNNTAYSITVFAAKGSTVDGIAGSIGVSMPAGTTYMFMATAANQWDLFDWNSSPVNNTNGVITTANMASLRLLDLYGSPYNYAVWMKGYYTTNDDGQGLFYWVTNNSSLDDGGTTIIPNPARTQYAWKRFINDNPNVKMWGATSIYTGSSINLADSAPMFNSALLYLFSNYNWRKLVVPHGTYRINSTISLLDGVSIEGADDVWADSADTGNYATTLQYWGTGFCMTAQNPQAISNLKFVSKSGDQSQSGLQISSAQGATFTGLDFVNFGTIGLQIGYPTTAGRACYFCTFLNIHVYNATDGQYGVIYEGAGIQNSSGHICNNIFVKGVYKYFIDIRGQTNVLLGGDCEPNYTGGTQPYNWIKSLIRFSGVANKVINQYIEPAIGTGPTAMLNSPNYITFFGPNGGVLLVSNPLDGDKIDFSASSSGSPIDATITFVNTVTDPNTQCQIGATVIDTNANLANMINAVDPVLAPYLYQISAENSYNTVLLRMKDISTAVGKLNSSAPTRVRVSANILNSSTGNRVERFLYLNSPCFNAYSSVKDQGIRNLVDMVPTGVTVNGISGIMQMPSQNLIHNSNFNQISAVTNLPYGWDLPAAPTAAMVMDYSVLFNGAPTIRMDITALGQSAQLNYWLHYPNLPNARQIFPAVDIEYIRGKVITIGIWCKSTIPQMGAMASIYSFLNSHSGSGDWELLATTLRVPWNATNASLQLALSIQSYQDGNRALAGSPVAAATIYFASPIAVIGDQLPQVNAPRNINDNEGLMMGRLAWNPPFTLTANQTTYDVSKGNVWTEANSVLTSVSTFTGGRPGQELTVLATTANMTFVHNAGATVNTIKTNTGANVTTAAGRAYKFVFNGTQWIMV